MSNSCYAHSDWSLATIFAVCSVIRQHDSNNNELLQSSRCSQNAVLLSSMLQVVARDCKTEAG